MRQHQHSTAVLEAIFMELTRAPRYFTESNDQSQEEQHDILPPLLIEQLQKIYAEIEGETLPEDLVILIRQINRAEHT